MKLAILASNLYDLPTGQQKIQREVIRALAELGVELLLITNTSCIQDLTETSLKDLTDFPQVILPGKPTAYTYLKSYPKIIRELQSFQPDLLFSFGCAMVALGAPLKKKLSVPWIHFAYEMACFNTPARSYFKFCLKRADQIICTSQFLKTFLSDQGIEPDKFQVIRYNFGDIKIMERTPEKGQIPNIKNVLFWGDAAVGRGHDILLQAIPQFLKEGRIQLTLLLRRVDDRFQNELKKAQSLPGIRIIKGPLESCRLNHFLNESDIVILPYTKTTIQPPLTLLESLGCGKLVITTDIDANSEIIGEGGILIQPGNISSLKLAIEETLCNFTPYMKQCRSYLQKENWLLNPDKKELKNSLNNILGGYV
jgi:glycosyltransferase involved in cell wall biosynthesis